MKLIKRNGHIDFYEKKSHFIGYSFFIESREEAEEIISQLWKEHRKATHICTALQVGFSQSYKDFDDNGEPSLTAGYPMLQLLEAQDLRQVLICAVRYFGGIKLGKGGLIRAYSKTAELVLEESGSREVIRAFKYKLNYDYTYHGTIDYILATKKVLGLEPLYSHEVSRIIYPQDQGLVEVLRDASDGRLNIEALGEYYIEDFGGIMELEKIKTP